MGIPEAEEKREKLFKETVSEHLPNLVTIINLYVQEAQQIPSRKNQRDPHQDIIIELLESKDKEGHLGGTVGEASDS